LAVASLAWQNESDFMVNQTNGLMNGWSGVGMWIWVMIGVAVAVMVGVAIYKLLKK
jgi:hypothetical protein